MPITPAQSRAARAILDISQTKVEIETGISQATLSIFEKEKGKLGMASKILYELQGFYDGCGVEFLERDGVRRKAAGLFELQDYEGFKKFIDDIYETVKGGGDICVTNVDERQFERWQGKHAQDYLARMAEVRGLTFRALIKEGDTYFTASRYATYRALPEKYFSGVPTYVYGTKKAEVLFGDNNVHIFIIDNSYLADAQRREFELAWEHAIEQI